MITVLISSCGKDDEPDPATSPLYIPSEVKRYTFFWPGTYWIYKDSVSGIEDSVYVSSETHGLDTVDGTGGNSLVGIFEWFQIAIHSAYTQSDYYYWAHMSYSAIDPKTKVWLAKEKMGSPVGKNLFFVYPLGSNVNYYSGYDTLTVTGYYNTMIINGVFFNNVIKMHYSENVIEDGNKTDFFISKNFGIVRKELLDSNKTWNLIRYQIIQ